MDQRLRALNRFGLGARVGEKDRIGDPRQWLREQLKVAPTLEAPEGASRREISETLRQFRMAGQQDDAARQEARRRLVRIAASEQRVVLTRRATTEQPFVERLVAFWSNHLCVSSSAKFPVAALAGSYEREAIRPHVLGKFEDMVLASARHPAMLFYLDNFQSIGPNSTAAQRARRGQRGQRGLNENYARELLELHTLGVNGGYTQDDVLQLARLLTGWTISGLAPQALTAQQRRRLRRAGVREGSGELDFVFQPLLHEPGDKTILGRKYGEGEDDGERAIRAFCRHPATAQFIATKLVTHFVADDPPKPAVQAIAATFTTSNGDLKKVAEALIELPDAWSASSKKFRTPQDWVIATWRLFDVRDVNEGAIGALRQLRHPLWAPPSPKGFGDATREWADPDSLLNRAELARTVARRAGAMANDVAPRLVDVMDVDAADPLRTMLADSSIDARERIALAIAGPAFQWR